MKQPNAQDLYVPCESVLRGKAHLLRILFFEFLTWMRWGAFLHHHYPISSNIFQSILYSTFHFLPGSLSLFFNIQFPKPFCALHQPLLPHFSPFLPFFTLFPPFSFLYNFYFSSRFIFSTQCLPMPIITPLSPPFQYVFGMSGYLFTPSSKKILDLYKSLRIYPITIIYVFHKCQSVSLSVSLSVCLSVCLSPFLG